MTTLPFGFRILGSCHEERRLVDHAGAFLGYATLDPRAAVEREGYLSAFTFGEDFQELLQSTGSVKGFDGPCWSPWLWFDIDRVDLDAALADARRLAFSLVERYRLDDDALLLFYSGSKGFHVGLPSALWDPPPSAMFNRVCRRLAEGIGDTLKIRIDTGVYDRVRAFRAPNSRHSKSGLYKRRLSFEELAGLSLEQIRKFAESPQAFDLPSTPVISERAKADWAEAAALVRQASEAKATRTANGNGKPMLNRQTLVFIRDGAGEGDRHRLLYSAARNLGEFGCPPALAHALLGEPALDCGLAPKEVHRQIECGLKDQSPASVEQVPTPSAPPAVDNADLQKQLAALWHMTLPTPTVETIPGIVGDAHEPPKKLDAPALEFPFGANGDGPYGKEGGRR